MNYQKVLDETLQEIEKQNIKPKLLLHACCAPCSSYVVEYLSKYFDITIYYYNPNIYPENEYNRRMNELVTFLKKIELKINFIEEKYIPEEYYNTIKGYENL